MLTLAIDTSTPAVAVAVGEVHPDADNRFTTLSEKVIVDSRAHGEQLAPLIEAALAEAGITAPKLSAIAVGAGPGPFTGLRVGLVTAAAMSHALGIPAYSRCSLDLIGHALPDDDRPVLVATDARRKEIYWALYEAGGRIAGPAVNKPAELPEAARGAHLAAGAGARQYAEVLGLPVIDGFDHPSPAVMLDLLADRISRGDTGDALTPLYLRRPDVHIAQPSTPGS
jgi:tRNA threonylcarbamoyl adenosine modification protein YeaZ